MKKFLGLMIAFIMLSLALVPQGALALTPPTPTLLAVQSATFSSVGDEVTVPVMLSTLPSGGLISAQTEIKYDSATLQFVGAEAGTIIRNASRSFLATPENGSVTLVFMDEYLGPNAIVDNGVFANLKFKVIKDIWESAIQINSFIPTDKQINSVPSTVSNGLVKKASPSKDLTLAVQQAVSYSALGDTVTVPVKLSGIPSTGVMGVQATIKYDASTLQYIAADAGPIIKNPTLNFSVNPQAGGVVMLFTDENLGNAMITSDGIFANLKFKVIKEIATESAISIDELAITDINIKELASKAVGGSVIPSVHNNLVITPSKVVFDMNNPADVTVTLPSGEVLADIKAGSASLTKGSDYTVSGSTVKISKSYYQYIFGKWPAVTNILTFNTVSGKTATLTATATAGTSLITPNKVVFDTNNPADVSVTITNGETLADIKAGSASLTKGTDYTISGNTVKILNSYYQYIFSKWPSVTNILTLNFVSGKSATLISTAVAGTSLITTNKVVFDMSNPADVLVTIANGETLSDIKAGSASLTKGTDYTVSGNTVKISKAYYQYIFSKWPSVTNILTFNFVSGKTAVLTATAVTGVSLITPGKITFDMGNPADVTITIANGETLADIKAGSASLTKGTDYTVSGNTVKISKAYYQYIFSKWPSVTNILTFNMSSGKIASLTTTAKAGLPLIFPSKVVFDMDHPDDVTITLAKGEEVESIKAGSAPLYDFKTVDNRISINKGYFYYIFSNWPSCTNVLTITTKSGKTAYLTTTAGKATQLIIPDRSDYIVNNTTDVGITIDSSETLAYVIADLKPLTKDVDYKISGNRVILSDYLHDYFKFYISTIGIDSNKLGFDFVMKSGKAAHLDILGLSDKYPYISHERGTFDRKNPSDINIPVIFSNYHLLSISNQASYTLKCGTDYTIEANAVILSKSFLGSLPGDVEFLTFVFASSKPDSPNISLDYSINIKDSTVKDSVIGPDIIRIKNSKLEDQNILITLNGNTLSSITNGGYTLILDKDYTLSENKVVLKADYLNTLKQNTALVFNFSAGTSSYLAVLTNTDVGPSERFTVILGSATAASGDVVTIPVILKEVPSKGLAYMGFLAKVDPSYIESVDFEAGPACPNPKYIVEMFGLGDNLFRLDYNVNKKLDYDNNKDYNNNLIFNNGVLGNLKLKLKPGIKGTTSIKITPELASGQSSPAVYYLTNYVEPIILIVKNTNTTIKDSTIDPGTVKVSKNNISDINVLLTLNGNTLSSINNGTYTLKPDVDYVLNESAVILKSSYLSRLSDSSSLVFNFSAGESSTLSILWDAEFNITLGSVTASSSSTVTVPVTVKGIPTAGLAFLQFAAQFDPAYVSSVAYEAGSSCTNPSKNLSVTNSGSKIHVSFIDSTMGDQLLLNGGVLVNLKLTLKDGIKGTTNIKITDFTASDVDFNTFIPKRVDSVITIN